MRGTPLLLAALVPAAAALALTAALAPGDAALGQGPASTSLSVQARVTPGKSGTASAPRAARLRIATQLTTPDGFEKPVVIGATVSFPKGISYNGGEYPACTWRILVEEGAGGCPKRSIMGRGTGLADADGEASTVKAKIVNGGLSRVYGYVTLDAPAKVSTAVPIAVKRLRHRRWQYRLTVTVPRPLQTVAGVPIALQSLELDMGKGAKGTRHRGSWLATTSCPKSNRRPYLVTARLDSGANLRRRGSMRCR